MHFGNNIPAGKGKKTVIISMESYSHHLQPHSTNNEQGGRSQRLPFLGAVHKEKPLMQ